MQFKNLKIGAKLGLLVSFALFITVSFVSLVAFFNLKHTIVSAKRHEFTGKEQLFKQSLAAQYEKAVMLSSSVASMPTVQEAFYKKDREALKDALLPVFDKLKQEYAVRQFQFHLPPATSFLRLHKLEKYGDDLSGFRKTVVEANGGKVEIAGLEVGVAGLGVRGVTPVFYQYEHVGTVEFGLNFGQSFFDNYKEKNGSDVALFINRDSGPELFASTFSEDMGLSAGLLDDIKIAENGLNKTLGGRDYALVSFPVYDYSGHELGDAVLAIDVSEYVSQLNFSLMISALSLLGASIIAFLFVRIVNKTVSVPLRDITERMEALLKGDTVSEVPCLGRKDEIGSIANAFSVFRDNAVEKGLLEKEAQEQQAQQKNRIEKVNQAVETFQTRIDDVLEHLNSATQTTQSDASTSRSLVEETLHQSMGAADSAEQAASNVQTVAAAVTELTASIQEISRSVQDAAISVKECNEYAAASAENLDRLQERVNNIDSVIAAINDVAEQTNLLALNATIEAARAGDAGKGFAVVANEVKSLATQTGSMTDEISAMMQEIKDSAKTTIVTVQNIVEQIKNVDLKTTGIAASVEQQNNATQEIDRSVNEAASGTQNISAKLVDIKDAADKSKATSDSLARSSDELAKQTRNIDDSVKEFLKEVIG
ncbi:MAG: methyl-accepting chemotaxis protein [Alphaproteobacteria bacterium]